MNNIPNIIRTGIRGEVNNDQLENVVRVLTLYFLKKVLRSVLEYSIHRNIEHEISFEIIERMCMLELMVLLEEQGFNEKLNHLIFIYYNEGLEGIDNYLEIDEEQLERNTEVCRNEYCHCNKCGILMNIENYWETFNPTEPYLIILKQKIDEGIIYDLLVNLRQE